MLPCLGCSIHFSHKMNIMRLVEGVVDIKRNQDFMDVCSNKSFLESSFILFHRTLFQSHLEMSMATKVQLPLWLMVYSYS